MIQKIAKVLLLGGLVCLLGVGSGFAVNYSEAPMLRAKVAAGELSPVAERLPANPLVVPVIERIGKYGGTLTSAYIPGDPAITTVFCSFEYMLHTDSDGGHSPNLAEKVEFSPDAKVMTVHLRKGVRWSDGAPFSADDVMFWYEDMVLNKEVTPVPPMWIAAEGGRLEKVDDYTIRFTFSVPSSTIGLALLRTEFIFQPKHYLAQFHPKYTSKEKLDKALKEMGMENWWQLIGDRSNVWFGPVGLPTLGPWIVKSITPALRIYERNPYFWKVDPAGNQLPYIDKVVFLTIAEKEMYVLKALQGEIDLSTGWILSPQDYPILDDSAEKEGYRVFQWDETDVSQVAYIFRQDHPDLVLRELFRDKRLRIAMSLAINRQEISEACFLGRAKVTQATVMPDNPSYREEFAKAYVEYDPDRANQLLDEIGLTERDKNGYRLRLDGEPLIITIWGSSDTADKNVIHELVTEYWKAVGINTFFKVVDRSLYNIKVMAAGEMEVDAWGVGGCLCGALGGRYECIGYFVPTGNNHVGPELVKWYRTKGKEGVEPPQYMIEGAKLFDQMLQAIDEEERIRVTTEILRNQAENLTQIGTVSAPPRPIVVKNYIHNVPEKGIWAWEIRCHKCYFNEQIFIEK